MRAHCFTGVIFALLFPGMIAQSSAQSPDPHQRFDQLVAATSLDREGQHPWHLRMSFDLYDLEGKKKESGTAEEWWVSPKSHRLVITSPSFNETIPSAKNEPTTINREAYLVHNLLDQVAHPIPHFGGPTNLKVEEKPYAVGKVKLSCLVVTSSVAKDKKESSQAKPVNSQFCTEPDRNVLRIRFDDGYGLEIVRNRLANFLTTSVALENGVSYGKLAITGHVDVLETYDPVKTPVELETSSREPETISGLVIAGHILSKTVPSYPQYARDQHISGTVVLCAIISKQGTISSLDVVASPDPSLSQSSLEAVKHWTYTPYLLDGVPTEIDTTITVNYALR
jgi:TonB family protein